MKAKPRIGEIVGKKFFPGEPLIRIQVLEHAWSWRRLGRAGSSGTSEMECGIVTRLPCRESASYEQTVSAPAPSGRGRSRLGSARWPGEVCQA